MIERIQDLLKRIEKGSREDIWEAAKELTAATTDMVLFLIGLLNDGQLVDTRAAAAYILGFGRFASARSALEQVLDDAEEDASVRCHAAEALSYIRAQESVEVLLRNLEDKNTGVQYWCTFALGQVGGEREVSLLNHFAELVGDQCFEDRSLRAEALDAIAEIHERHGSVGQNLEE